MVTFMANSLDQIFISIDIRPVTDPGFLDILDLSFRAWDLDNEFLSKKNSAIGVC